MFSPKLWLQLNQFVKKIRPKSKRKEKQIMKSRKMFFSLIAALLIVTTAFAPAVYAANPFNNVWKSSPESVQKFNEYISSLPEEEAALILADEELVFNMKLDSYWETNNVSTNSVRAVSLPLSDYTI